MMTDDDVMTGCRLVPRKKQLKKGVRKGMSNYESEVMGGGSHLKMRTA